MLLVDCWVGSAKVAVREKVAYKTRELMSVVVLFSVCRDVGPGTHCGLTARSPHVCFPLLLTLSFALPAG